MKEYELTKVNFEDSGLWIFFADVATSVNFAADGKDDAYYNHAAAEKMKKGDKILLEGMLGDEPLNFWGIGTTKSIYWRNEDNEFVPVYLSAPKVQVAPNSFLARQTISKLGKVKLCEERFIS